VLLLVLICLVMGIALIVTSKQASERARDAATRIGTLSNYWIKTSAELEDQRNVAALLEKDLQKQRSALSDLTNNYLRLSANMAQANANLAKTEASLKATEDEVKKRDERISALENQNVELDRKALDLSNAITNLTVQISETQRKLAASEGDKAYLEKELKRLMAEKSELERQFNDLTILRAQVTRLKEELSIARRIEWIRQGIFAGNERKGAQALMEGPRLPPKPRPEPSLDVELTSEGGVKVNPPGTNAPASTDSPPK
jgi:chromosome segregation ATPase